MSRRSVVNGFISSRPIVSSATEPALNQMSPPVSELHDLGLRFGQDGDPSLKRLRTRNGRFRYVDEHGATVDATTCERIERLAIPPAWTSVWIARRANSHIQATGRDARGRKQYRYHPDFRAHNETTKFADLLTWATRLPTLRRRLESDVAHRRPDREKVIALAIMLLDETSIRVGNEHYAQANGSYGLTTLRTQHARVLGDTIRLQFVGKSGKFHDVSHTDRRLARALKAILDLPGELLFHYESSAQLHPVHASDINDYLTTTMGTAHTAKTFRTWNATVSAAAFLGARPAPETPHEAQRVIAESMRATSVILGNTPAVARASYVHPSVVTGFADGSLSRQWAKPTPNAPRSLSADERRAMQFLKRTR